MYRSISLLVALLFVAHVSLAQFNIRPVAIGSPQPNGSKTCTPLVPTVMVANIGNQASPGFTVLFTIRDLFSNQIVYGPSQQTVNGLNQGQQQQVQFTPQWMPQSVGTFQATVIVQAGDNIPMDDTNRQAFTVASGWLSRQQAIVEVSFDYIPTSPFKDNLGLYLHNKNGTDSLLAPGTIISATDDSFLDTIRTPSYLFVVDDEPGKFLMHSFSYVIVDGCSGEHRSHTTQGLPVLNGVQVDYASYDGNFVNGNRCPPGTSITPTTYIPTEKDTLGWAIIVPGPPIDAGDWDDFAIPNDIERIKDILNNNPLGPGLPGKNIRVAGDPKTGATLKDICDAMDSLKGKACNKVYFYYVGHGYPQVGSASGKGQGLVLKKEPPATGTENVSYDVIARKMIEAGIQNVDIVIMGCYSGAAIKAFRNAYATGPDGKRHGLTGTIVVSSGGEKTTTGATDGSVFHKAMTECGKDIRADLNRDSLVTALEACVWAKLQNAVMQSDGADCGNLRTTEKLPFKKPHVSRRALKTSPNVDTTIAYEIITFFYPPQTKGGKPQPTSRRFVYIINTYDVNLRAGHKLQLFWLDKKGVRHNIGEPKFYDLAPNERLCIGELPEEAVDAGFEAVAGNRNIITQPLTGTFALQDDYSVKLLRNELMAIAYHLSNDSGTTYTASVDGPAGWSPDILPKRFFVYDTTGEYAFIVYAFMPDTATQGGQMDATIISTDNDTLVFPITVLLSDSTHTAQDLNRSFNYSWVSHDSTEIFMTNGSTLSLTNSTLSLDPQHLADSTINLFIEKFTFINSQIQTDSLLSYNLFLNRDIDWQNSSVVGADKIKVSADNLNVHIENGMIINSKEYGIEIEGERADDIIRGIHIDSATGTALRIRSASNITIRDFRIEHTSGFDVSASLSSNVRLVDTYFDSSKVERPTDSLTRAWTTFFVVSDTAGDPLDGVILTIRNKNNVTIARDTTDPLGFSRIHELVQYILHDTKSTDFAVYTIDIKYNGKDSSFNLPITDRTAHEIHLLRAPSSVARERVSQFAVSQHPNPATNNICIGFTLAKPSDVKITVYDALGKVIADSKAFYPSGKNEARVNVSGLPAGWYVYEVNVEGIRERYRFIKE